MSAAPPGFAGRVVQWQEASGRRGLPWQGTRDPYRVWLSEIMLQQTQVATVLGYYERFVLRLPDVRSLAAATLDEVLALWAGLGYYSRARNLHRCAQDVVRVHGGEFPRSAQLLEQLPGIGRSTAAAIASFCFSERVAILDGNVRRVLARLLAFEGDLAVAAQERLLWAHATELLPTHRIAEHMPRYTQGLMDLGAGLCLPRKPDCPRCPVSDICKARVRNAVDRYPVRTRKTKRTTEAIWLLEAKAPTAGSVWLEKRPLSGIWAGMHCLPAFSSRAELDEFIPEQYRSALREGDTFTSVLTHKDLLLTPVRLDVPRLALRRRRGAWFNVEQLPQLALPAPIRRMLQP